MDFSVLNEALASKSFDKIADICDNLMLLVAAEGVPFQDEWPFAIHLLGHIYVDDINSARFLGNQYSELVAAWKIGQKLWTRDYAGVYQAIRGFDWTQETQVLVAAFSELYTNRMFELLQSAYSTISIQDAAQFLGMSEEDATNFVKSLSKKLDEQGLSPMHLALKKNQTATVHRLLETDADLVRVKGREGFTPLHYVVEQEDVKILHEFLEVSPGSITDKTNRGETALHIAVIGVNFGLFTLFIILLLLVFCFCPIVDCFFTSENSGPAAGRKIDLPNFPLLCGFWRWRTCLEFKTL